MVNQLKPLTQPTTERALFQSFLSSLDPDPAIYKSQINDLLEEFDEDDAKEIIYDWFLWARDNQLAPVGDWLVWVILAGRGFGKTRTGAEWCRDQVTNHGARRLALVAATAADYRDVMIEGESGILAISHPDFMPEWKSASRHLIWPNGAIATCYSAEKPRQLRGPQHDKAWCDELCAWKYGQDTWDMLLFGLRLGDNPQAVVTTTPRPIKVLKSLLAKQSTHKTTGSTYDNAANLAPSFMEAITAQYAGTRLGRQELEAEILDDNPDALWTRSNLDENRVSAAPDLTRIVVGVDPSVTSGADACDTGIVVVGKGRDNHGYVLDDMTTHDTPIGWAKRAVYAYTKYHADAVIVEANNGGEMCEAMIRLVRDDDDNPIGENVNVIMVHATRGKYIRAEPVSGMYEQGRGHHVGFFHDLEDQLCEWSQGQKSPDRLDALVWAYTDLFIDGNGDPRAYGVFDSDEDADDMILHIDQY